MRELKSTNGNNSFSGVISSRTSHGVRELKLQNAWKSIATGMEDFDKMQKNAHQKRLKELDKLDEVKKDFHKQYKMPHSKHKKL